jgi:DNA-directed RNA polymerase specialized sigma24 family protein
MIRNSKAPAQEPGNYSGDADLGSIANDFYGSVLSFAIGLTKSETDAADLVQQTFLSLSHRLLQRVIFAG